MAANDIIFLQGELDDLLELESGLDDYELKFVEDMAEKVKKKGIEKLTPGQVTFMRKLWDNLCG